MRERKFGVRRSNSGKTWVCEERIILGEHYFIYGRRSYFKEKEDAETCKKRWEDKYEAS